MISCAITYQKKTKLPLIDSFLPYFFASAYGTVIAKLRASEGFTLTTRRSTEGTSGTNTGQVQAEIL